MQRGSNEPRELDKGDQAALRLGARVFGIALLYMMLTDALAVMGVALVLDLLLAPLFAPTELWDAFGFVSYGAVNGLSIAIVVYAVSLQRRGGWFQPRPGR